MSRNCCVAVAVASGFDRSLPLSVGCCQLSSADWGAVLRLVPGGRSLQASVNQMSGRLAGRVAVGAFGRPSSGETELHVQGTAGWSNASAHVTACLTPAGCCVALLCRCRFPRAAAACRFLVASCCCSHGRRRWNWTGHRSSFRRRGSRRRHHRPSAGRRCARGVCARTCVCGGRR